MSELPTEYIPADDSDKSYFHELNKVCYIDVVTRQFGSWDDELQTEYFDVKWQTQDFNKIIRHGQLVGGVWLDKLEDSYQLKEIQIHPDHQNQGIGRSVLDDVIATAQHAEKRLWLKVLHQNQAVDLYKRLGFTVTAKTEAQYIMEYRP
jgi:ribosomal protein S18 acetylase RimI-like enzyme|tara:strand:+ start:3529 stop:3975 length:447 start_codon:yes stop_codon:yes gene_type:complete